MSSGQQSAEIFADWSLYDKVIHFDYMRHQQMARVISTVAASRPQPLAVLDLGCGDGRMAAAGLQGCQVESYVGIDLSAAALEAARKHLAPLQCTLDLRQMDIEAGLMQPFNAAPNLVLASYSLHHYQYDALPALLNRLAEVVHADSVLIWIDLERKEQESREQCVVRYAEEQLSAWSSIASSEKEEIKSHMIAADFPLSARERQQLIANAGFRHLTSFIHDATYSADAYAIGKL